MIISATSKTVIWGRIFAMNLHVESGIESAFSSLQVAQMRTSGTTKYFQVVARHKVLVDIFNTAWMIIMSNHCKVRNNGDHNSPFSHNVGVLVSVQMEITSRLNSTRNEWERNSCVFPCFSYKMGTKIILTFEVKTQQSCHKLLFQATSSSCPPCPNLLWRLKQVGPNFGLSIPTKIQWPN